MQFLELANLHYEKLEYEYAYINYQKAYEKDSHNEDILYHYGKFLATIGVNPFH